MHIWVPRPVIECEQRITLPADIFSGRIRATVYNERGGVLQCTTNNNMVLDNCVDFILGYRNTNIIDYIYGSVEVGTGTAEPQPTDTGLTDETKKQTAGVLKSIFPPWDTINDIYAQLPPYEHYASFEIGADQGAGDFTEWVIRNPGSYSKAYFKGLFRDDQGNPVVVHKPAGSVLVVEHWFTINALPDVLVRTGTIQGGPGGAQTYSWAHYYNNDNLRYLGGRLYNTYNRGILGDSDAPSTSATLAHEVLGQQLSVGSISISKTEISKTRYRYTLAATSNQLNGVAIREFIPIPGIYYHYSDHLLYSGGRFTFTPGITKTDEYAMSIAVELELGLTR